MTIEQTVAKLNKGLRRHYFMFAMDSVWSAYIVARDSLSARRDGAEQETRERWGLGPDDPPPVYEDETGWSPDFGEQVWELASSAEDSLVELRTAFLIVIYHTFERFVLKAMGTDKFSRSAVISYLGQSGFAPDDAALHLLRVVANACKHAPGDSLAKLRKLRPDLIGEEDEVRISESELDCLTRCVRYMKAAAGPDAT